MSYRFDSLFLLIPSELGAVPPYSYSYMLIFRQMHCLSVYRKPNTMHFFGIELRNKN